MNALVAPYGRTGNGLPYNKLGDGAEPLVVFDGLSLENDPMQGLEARLELPMYEFLSSDYTVYVVRRRKGLPQGYAVDAMSEDYAEMIREEFAPPVDIIGYSYGGTIALVFAADHPELVHKLVIQSAGSVLSPLGRELLTRAHDCALAGDWRHCIATMMEATYRPSWYKPVVVRIAPALSTMLGVPDNPSDFAIAIEAERDFDFGGRLSEVSAPTLLAVTDRDVELYGHDSIRAIADGIQDCIFVQYPHMGHPAKGPAFERDVMAFLRG